MAGEVGYLEPRTRRYKIPADTRKEVPIPERKARKSVAFSEGTTIVDENGAITIKGSHEENHTAMSHSPSTPPLSKALGAFTNPFEEDTIDAAAEPAAQEVDHDADVADMLKGMKKKKKSKKVDAEEGDAPAEGAVDGAADGEAADAGLDLSLKKKKKKKAPKETGDDFEDRLAKLNIEGKDGEEGNDEAPQASTVVEGDMEKGTGIWQHDDTTPIVYDLLLDRFFELLAQKNPDHASSGSRSYKIPPPQCLREGNKKTIFANLAEICKRMKRTDEHVTSYLFAELGTSGSVDGSRRLVIKGRFQQKQIENVLRRYISTSSSPYHMLI
jgi:translation initiation factor 2 subunit 2